MAKEADNLVEVIGWLERQPLRNIVLLKHIEAFREHVLVTQVCDGSNTATLVLLNTTGSPYERPIRRRLSPRSYRATILA
jgi:hypothetical protein